MKKVSFDARVSFRVVHFQILCTEIFAGSKIGKAKGGGRAKFDDAVTRLTDVNCGFGRRL